MCHVKATAYVIMLKSISLHLQRRLPHNICIVSSMTITSEEFSVEAEVVRKTRGNDLHGRPLSEN